MDKKEQKKNFQSPPLYVHRHSIVERVREREWKKSGEVNASGAFTSLFYF